MKPVRTAVQRRNEQGYALMLVLFFLALLALGTMAAMPNTITNGRREKEEEMVWRGKQYVRGIRLFYQKNHRFPTQLEDLYQPKTGIRFMRQAYKDPMNPADGSWRLIYVGPNGQLIGSLKVHTLNASGQPGQGFGSAPGANGSSNQSSFGNSSFGNSSFGGSSSGNSSFGGNNSSLGGNNSSFGGNNSSFGGNNSSFNNSSFGGNSSFGSNSNQNGAAGGAQNTQNGQNPQDPNDANAANGSMGEMSTPQSLAASDDSTPTIMGGNIIGVGSKVNKASFMWYEKAKNYRQFEFIWDPSIDSMTGRAIGAPPPSTGLFGSSPNSQNPNASPFSSGTPNTNMNGQNPSSNPNANPNSNSNEIPPLQAPPQ
jgi:hypothetical protein